MIWLILFIGIPLTDLYILVKLSSYMGLLATLAIVILTGISGWRLLKMQGRGVWARANSRLASGELPGDEMLEGVALVASGALLITPGIITDVMGLLLLIPPFRRLLVHFAKQHLKAHIHMYHVDMDSSYGAAPFGAPPFGGPPQPGERTHHSKVVDATWKEHDS